MSLVLVIGVVLMLGYLMRRFNVTQTGSSQMQVVASMMTGARERIVVIQVGDEQHLIGITAHNINHLTKLETPIQPDNPGAKFKSRFNQLLQKQAQSGRED
ncbi:flagellar biosynthetic protein FliO [Paraneptunicella aestuarii]|uniref:flagellar biosynthetic protein FliO n=1 Tax=Paraneptunicella aestuarii TaxID=2831148 RepID=UPI001E644814|nr:flagellar biosynthetic protein FliO [Paraneptunicella aestuarii]UAA38160.1 flagellar biosynthetic protein FliO [Paraneptunicella aestuarii]